MRVRPRVWGGALGPSMSTSMSMVADRMKEVWLPQPCTNFATDASWSLATLGEISQVSRRRRRKLVLPVIRERAGVIQTRPKRRPPPERAGAHRERTHRHDSQLRGG